MEKNKKLLYISLAAMSVCNLIISCINLFDIELPDFIFVFFIIATLAAVFALLYTSIKLWLGSMDNKK
ncbi:MAG: hypothetical protein IJ306_06150 [Oscillospiraceae bacterium]|nr:hypothetical protein [Oscillospiraceae bacterium]